jgi:hypothetical protein
MVGKTRQRRGDKGFLFLDFAACGFCGHSITGERHIKKSGLRFHYYRCSHQYKLKHYENRGLIRQEKFANEVKRNVQLVLIPDEWKEKFLAMIETWETDTCLTRQRQIDGLRSELASLKSRLDRVNNAFVDGSLELQEFKELKNPLVERKVGLEQRVKALEGCKANRIEPLRNWILQSNRAEKWASTDKLAGNEVISQNHRIEPPFTLTDPHRVIQKTLESIG